MEFEERFTEISIENRKAKIRHIEATERKFKKILIFIPGLGSFADIYKPLMRKLKNLEYRFISVDLLGFGGSRFIDTPKFSFQIFSLALAEWVKLNSFDKFDVFATSFGAGVTFGLFELIPNSFDKIILSAPAGFGKKVWWAYRVASFPIVNRFFAYLTINSFVDENSIQRSYKYLFHDSSVINQELITDALSFRKSKHSRRTYQYILDKFISLSGVPDWILEIIDSLCTNINEANIPVLVLWGELDDIVPAEYFDFVVNKLNAKGILIPEAKHLPYYEKVDQVSKEIEQFLI